VKNVEAIHRFGEERNILRTVKGRLSGLVTSCVRTTLQNTLFKKIQKRRTNEKEDVSSYWMTLKKREGSGIVKKEL
jgi:hypothetical protein